jgi:hypothetical protein
VGWLGNGHRPDGRWVVVGCSRSFWRRAATWAGRRSASTARHPMRPNHPFNQAIAKIGEVRRLDALVVFAEGDRNEAVAARCCRMPGGSSACGQRMAPWHRSHRCGWCASRTLAHGEPSGADSRARRPAPSAFMRFNSPPAR